MPNPFLERLKRGPILGDGAMGTYLYSKGASFKHAFDELNLSSPTLVASVHDEYIQAGSELIETNTYSANRLKLARYGIEDKVRQINIQGARIARDRREALGKDVFVGGSIGPLGRLLGSFGGVSTAEAHSAFREQVEALLEGGVDLLIIETIADVQELIIAVEEVRKATNLPVVGQVTISDDLSTIHGNTPFEVLETARRLKLDVVGANCSVGPQRIYDFLSILRNNVDIPLSAQPNAGLPRYHEGRFFYITSPDYFADYCRQFLNLGVSLIGGCCGTTPQHIRAMARVLQSFEKASGDVAHIEIVGQASPTPTVQVQARSVVSNFASKLGKKFVVSVEIDPPRGANPEKVLKAAAKLKEAGVDAVNVADSPMARVRMSCLAVSALIVQQLGMEIILHFTTRDRNLMGLQSDLIGAHALGIHNILAITGDPPSMGDYPNATAVYDVDSIGLVEIISRLNGGIDLAGNQLGSPSEFSIGVAVNPSADNLNHEVERLKKKIAAGAQFAMTQPLYELETLERFLEAARNVKLPILLGLLPLQSYRHAEFLHNEVPGITIPQCARDRLRESGSNASQVGIEMCRDLFQQAKHHIQGAYLMPSFGRYETVLQVLQ